MIAYLIQPLILMFSRKNFHGKILSSVEWSGEGWLLGVRVKKQLKVDEQREGLQ